MPRNANACNDIAIDGCVWVACEHHHCSREAEQNWTEENIAPLLIGDDPLKTYRGEAKPRSTTEID
ncbi:MAG: hypothetical protein Aurels2KO_25920 [Aureliella sp.]